MLRILELSLRLLSSGRLPIFIFHKVPLHPDPLASDEVGLSEFELLLDYIESQFQIVPLEDAVAMKFRGGDRRYACLTFDDGYPDWSETVGPSLLRRNLHATFFITTGQLSGVPLWHERIVAAIARATGEVRLSDRATNGMYSVSSAEEKKQAICLLVNLLKYLPLEQRDRSLAELEASTGGGFSADVVMTEDAIRALSAKGFGIGAHTLNHPILSRCGPKAALREIGEPREILAGIIGGPVTGFAYPNGHPQKDFGVEHVRMVKECGYRYALTTGRGVAGPNSSRFQLPRFTPWSIRHKSIAFQLVRNLMEKPFQFDE